MSHFTLRVTGPHFGNVFNITYTDVSFPLCDILTTYINETFKASGVVVNFQSSLYTLAQDEFVKIPQASVCIALSQNEMPLILYGMSNTGIIDYLANFTNARAVRLFESNLSVCEDTVVAQPVFMEDRTDWDACIDCSVPLGGAQLCYDCLNNAIEEHLALSQEEIVAAEIVENIVEKVFLLMDLHQIKKLKNKTWGALNTLWIENEYKNKMTISYGKLLSRVSRACLFNGMVFEFINVYYEGSLVDRHIWFPKNEHGTLELREDDEVEVIFYLVRSMVEETVEVDLDELEVEDD